MSIKTISAKGMRWLVWSIYFIMLVTIIISWVFYPVRYDFFYEATSVLGGLSTGNAELPNFPSCLIFSIGFGILGAMATFIAIAYFRNSKRFRFAIVKGVLLIVVGLGAIGIAVPHDFEPLRIFHIMGAFMFLSGIAVLNFAFQLLHCISLYNPQCPDRDLDYYIDYTFVVLLIITAAVYFTTEILFYFWPAFPWIQPPLAQKTVLFTAVIAAGLLDLDDIK
ncbi:MAG: hypothetical protein JW776_08940 [Candidatus Lokiarchaeota archaeon]|nr:hypothetical protein [Candidatus Lokiarchaeota archaeon]